MIELPTGQDLAHLTPDEALIFSLRLRDGRANAVPSHRNSGACKYARVYDSGGCDWCAAADVREAYEAPVQPNPNVIVIPARWQHDDEELLELRIA